MLISRIELVRRVVETRRLHAAGGAPVSAYSTAPLPPVNEKSVLSSQGQSPQNSAHANGEKSADADDKKGFWDKLRCW